MDPVIDIIKESIEQNRLLATAESVVVGVSGGPDSLCLLHALCRLRTEYRLALHVAHLHHGLRGADADADAQFVRTLAEDWELPCVVEQVDVPALAREYRLAVEEAARRARYAFLSRVAATVGSRTIAVGHNADDQAETVLMHFVRGSGLAGLRGMLPITPLGQYRLLESPSPASALPDIRLIRPLLEVTRAQVLTYCEFHGLEPRFDRSNLDTTYFRNWLRHEVLPLLETHNPKVRQVIRRSARVVADDYASLGLLLQETWPRVVIDQTAERFVFDLVGWRELPVGLQRSTLREAVHCLRRSLRDIGFVHIENALRVARDGTTGDKATLPQGLMLTVGYGQLTIAAAEEVGPLPPWPLLPQGCPPVPVLVPGLTRLPGSRWFLQAELVTTSRLPVGWAANADPWLAFLDADVVVGETMWLRTWQPGDRFQPQGMKGRSVKLADFYTNQKVPRAVRERVPLLEGERGILWVCGQRLDERSCVRDATERVLVMRFRCQDASGPAALSRGGGSSPVDIGRP